MTVLHPFRRAAAVLAACAVLALGVVALVASQSQPARAASVGEFTLTPGSGSLSDPQPFSGSLQIPGACPDATIEDVNWNSVLTLFVVKADGTEARVQRGITNQAPYTAASSTVSLAAADNPGMGFDSLSSVITADGTYELRVRCVDNFSWDPAPEDIVPGDPYWSQKITVTGGDWMVGEGAKATSTELVAAPPVVEPGKEVTLTATTSPADAVGDVKFVEGDTTLGEASVADGKAEFKTTALAVGDHDIVARFTPTDATRFVSSESASFRVTVQPARYEIQDASGTRLADNPELERGQAVKLIVRRCQPSTSFALSMDRNDAGFPSATSDANGTVTWTGLTVPDDAVEGTSGWTLSPGCDAGGSEGTVTTVAFKVPAPPSGSPSATPTDDPTDDPTDEPTDEPTATSTDDTGGTTDGGGTTGGDSTTSGGGSGSGGSSGGGGLASTGSQIALFSGVGAVVLTAAGIAFVRYGRRNGLLTFGEPRS
ncbi:Ig-like domain-containing protein [Streptomyces sp. NPDC093970]|uniref:Ig-like domain-containing protein n=1 Tax=Streptomyces sp. NPDC093970 TaxID=3155076 RepID=UPI003426880B